MQPAELTRAFMADLARLHAPRLSAKADADECEALAAFVDEASKLWDAFISDLACEAINCGAPLKDVPHSYTAEDLAAELSAAAETMNDEVPHTDPNAEHRLTARELGVGAWR